jgi:hypothetical protein
MHWHYERALKNRQSPVRVFASTSLAEGLTKSGEEPGALAALGLLLYRIAWNAGSDPFPGQFERKSISIHYLQFTLRGGSRSFHPFDGDIR